MFGCEKAFRIVIIVAVLMSGGCRSRKTTATISAVNPYTEHLAPMDIATTGRIGELVKLESREQRGLVAALYLVPGTTRLLVVTTGDGFLRSFDIKTAQEVFKHDLGIVSESGVGYDRDGHIVIGSRQKEVRNDGFGLTEYIGDIGIWDTMTGSLLECVDLICFEGERWAPLLLSAMLDPRGTRVLDHTHLSYSMSDILGGNVSSISMVNNPDWANQRAIGRMVFDATGERIAIAFQEGGIEVEGGWPILPLGQNKWGDRKTVTALEFSPNGRHLARIRNEELSVWDLGVLKGEVSFSGHVPGGQFLAFTHHTGLLFVGDTDEILIWDIEEGELVLRLPTPGITAITISADDRLVIWGDHEGVIHIWGAPNQD
ncbi:MAG: hypothetical protein JRF62_16510 [Deltaproteobacteria bacterium]|nr:hypothetical protein [Deltaproteobacteria bacterium]